MPHLSAAHAVECESGLHSTKCAQSASDSKSEEGGQQFSAVLVRDETAATKEQVLAVFLISAGSPCCHAR
jgi:hypothetical protein